MIDKTQDQYEAKLDHQIGDILYMLDTKKNSGTTIDGCGINKNMIIEIKKIDIIGITMTKFNTGTIDIVYEALILDSQPRGGYIIHQVTAKQAPTMLFKTQEEVIQYAYNELKPTNNYKVSF